MSGCDQGAQRHSELSRNFGAKRSERLGEERQSGGGWGGLSRILAAVGQHEIGSEFFQGTAAQLAHRVFEF